ncbi:response regulator transcription factor, partial [Crocinitomicaceae bacterium]|nr:response regulator transcription factor [Crocinitomicaceae bacterium]
IESLFRRFNSATNKEKQPDNIHIDVDRYLVKVNDIELILPKKEFELLRLLSSRPGKVFSREQILHLVWGDEAIVGERTIDVHIRKLREKIGNSYIRTVKGVGYTFQSN